VAAGLTLLVGGLLLGFTDITRVGVLVSALPLLAGLSAGRSSNGIAVTRTVQPSRLVVDQPAQVTVVLQNPWGRRTQLQLAEDGVPDGLGATPRFVLSAMEPGEVREVSYEIRCEGRGLYRLGPLTLHRQDPYGLATITESRPGSTDLLVLPRIERLGPGRLGTSGVGGDSSVPHLLSLHDEDDIAVRSYRDGDDLRRIHWPSTAHRSELMMRQEDHPARRRAVIVLDSRAAGHQGSGITGSFEWAVTAAASIAAHLSEHEYTLQVASSEIATEAGSRQTLEINDAVASLAMARLGPSHQFDEVLHWAQRMTSPGGLVIAIVTDHDEEMLRRTAALRQPAGTGLMLLLDSASFARPGAVAGTDRTRALADTVAAAGWSTAVVGAGLSVRQAWNTLSPGAAGPTGSSGISGLRDETSQVRAQR